jgi:hypothetical protein
MFTSRNFKALLLLSASVLLFHPHASAQSGRRSPTPGARPGPAPTPADDARYEKVRVLVAQGLESFVKALNEQGQLGYRLEKTVAYDGPEEPRRYAGLLHLDPGHRYEYASDPVPEDARYGDPFNAYPRLGYTFVHAYTQTYCRKVDVFDPSSNYPPDSPSYTRQETHAEKRSALLFMRRDDETQTKEYKTFKGQFALDGGQKKELQDALNAAPPGFRPVSVFFSGGPHLFNATVLAERDLNEAAPPKVEYELVKEVFGFEDAVNRLAAAGSRYVVAGRVEWVKLAVLARQAADATAYTFVEDHKHRKGFPKEAAAGQSYLGLMGGDQNCQAVAPSGTDYQRLVFERGTARATLEEYKVLEISDRGPDRKKINGLLPGASLPELQRLLAEGFRVRDLFYHHGLYVILERQAGARVPPVQTSAR